MHTHIPLTGKTADDDTIWQMLLVFIIIQGGGENEQLVLPLKDHRENWQSVKISLKSLKMAIRRGEGYNRQRKWCKETEIPGIFTNSSNDHTK